MTDTTFTAASPHGAPGLPLSGRGGSALVEKTLDILRCFVGSRDHATLSELSALTRIPVSTCHRIVWTLVAAGFLERGTDKSFRVGTELWRIARHSRLALVVRTVTLPGLWDLHRQTGENAVLAVCDADRALYIEQISGAASVPTVSRAGEYLPLHTTGVGQVLLAHRQPSEIEDYLAGPLVRPTIESITDPVRLTGKLERIRRQGYAVTRHEMTTGSGSVSVPIFDGEECIAAIGVIAHVSRLDVRSLLTSLRSAVSGICEQLARS